MCGSVRKNKRSSAYAATLNSFSVIWNPLIELFACIRLINSLSDMMKSKGDNGQPCLIPFFVMTLFDSVPFILSLAEGFWHAAWPVYITCSLTSTWRLARTSSHLPVRLSLRRLSRLYSSCTPAVLHSVAGATLSSVSDRRFPVAHGRHPPCIVTWQQLQGRQGGGWLVFARNI